MFGPFKIVINHPELKNKLLYGKTDNELAPNDNFKLNVPNYGSIHLHVKSVSNGIVNVDLLGLYHNKDKINAILQMW